MEYGFIIAGTVGQRFDWWTGQKGTTADEVKEFLDKHKDEDVHIAITSPGGYVAEGLTIGQYFKDHGKVHCHIMGMSASIATVLAMSAATVDMAAGSLMLIHQASTGVSVWESANKDDLDAIIQKFQKISADLNTIDRVIASIYSQKNGKTIEENLEKMKAAAWLSPEDALEWGLIDEIRKDEDVVKESDNIKNRATNLYTNYGLPPIPVASGIADANGEPTQSFIQKTVDKLRTMFAVPESTAQSSNSSTTVMKKNFVMLAALLAVDAIAFTDGNATVNEEQAGKIEDELNRLTKAMNDALAAQTKAEDAQKDVQAKLDAALKDLKAKEDQIKNLQKLPGAQDPEPEPQHVEDAEPTAQDLYNMIKDY